MSPPPQQQRTNNPPQKAIQRRWAMLSSSSYAGILAILRPGSFANLLNAMTDNATPGALKFQPTLDFDKDTCYHVAAIDSNGNLNEGRPPVKFDAGCRTNGHLFHSNTYARQRCNHGWCAYMYGYYFEDDYEPFEGGHRHDWEHVIVWALNDEIAYVSWSAHGDYTTAHHTSVRFLDGTHPKIIGHRANFQSHSLRLAEPADEAIENQWGVWFKAWLLSRETMPDRLGHALLTHDWGSAHVDLMDERFGGALERAAPWDAIHNEGFKPHEG